MVYPLYTSHVLTGRSPDFASLAFRPTLPGIETILAPTRGMLLWHRQLWAILELVAPDLRGALRDDVVQCCMLGNSEWSHSVLVSGRTLADVLFERAAFRDSDSHGFTLGSDDFGQSMLWEAMTGGR